MKEFTSQTGGRHTYIDDIMNLQDLSLAFASIFDGCDNFIISGCQVSGNSISAGYVYINGKIRYCDGTSSANQYPYYIYESNKTESVSYVDSEDKVGRNVYGCAMGNKAPQSTDPLTGLIPQSIAIQSDGSALRLKDAFFGKYTLILDPSSNQTVKKALTVQDLITTKQMEATESIQLTKGNKNTLFSYDGSGNLNVQATIGNGEKLKMSIQKTGVFQFFVKERLALEIGEGGVIVKTFIQTPEMKAGNLTLKENHLYNSGSSSDDGVLNINMLGNNGKSDYFRDTVIGDGKNTPIVTFHGKTKNTVFSSYVTISSGNTSPLVIKHPTGQGSDRSLTSFIHWVDRDGRGMVKVGYTNATDTDFYIHNVVGNLKIANDTYISGKLYVGGSDVMEMLANKKTVNEALGGKADSSNVYSKEDADATFVKLSDGIGAYVELAGGGSEGQVAVCETIGAATVKDIEAFSKKSELFKDVVTYGLDTEDDMGLQKKILARQVELCQTIGAAHESQLKAIKMPKDTNWIRIQLDQYDSSSILYARQIGNTVCIEGELNPAHAGRIFVIPKEIDPPRFKIGYNYNKSGQWQCAIEGGSRECYVDYCNGGCSKKIGFLMTYFV